MSIKKDVIRLLETDLYYEIHGEGIPIIMLHGWGVDLNLMSGCMERFFEQYRYEFKRIYIDLPGMGNSNASKSIRKSDDILNVILAFIQEVISDRQFILVGESYGGYLARALLQRKSKQILGLLLICPLMYPGYRQGNIPKLKVLEKDNIFIESLSDKERSYFEYITIIQNRKVWERFKTDIYDALIKNENSHFLNNVLDGAFSYDIDKLEKPFDKPGLIMVGKQDTEVGYIDQFKLLEKYPRTSFAVLDKAGHNLQIEQVELFNSLVHEWLERLIAEL